MATLRNKRKLAAVSRETPESSRNGRTQSILDPKLTQDYISQVSEEIEGRVTKKLSKEFSRTESRILGALSKLDEFLLNPQVRTCSVVAPGTSRSNNLDNQGTNEDRPSNDPGPEVEISSPIAGAETNPHNRIKKYSLIIYGTLKNQTLSVHFWKVSLLHWQIVQISEKKCKIVCLSESVQGSNHYYFILLRTFYFYHCRYVLQKSFSKTLIAKYFEKTESVIIFYP